MALGSFACPIRSEINTRFQPKLPNTRYNRNVAILEFPTARKLVIDTFLAHRSTPEIELIPLIDASGRVLAQSATADRDYQPFDRSVRDGFAIRSIDLPGELRVVGEVQAGRVFAGDVGPGQAVEIMTGAPVPAGADQIVMVEHAEFDAGIMRTTRPPCPGEFINYKGCESKSGTEVLSAGIRLNYSSIAVLATIGQENVPVFRKPKVAILATGDEIVPVGSQPEPHQIRDSNSYSIAAQVLRAGGIPHILPVAKDNLAQTRALIEQALDYDLVLLSGGVSAGKYDFVEPVLAALGAEFFFDGVLIQPGKPLVFGRVRDKLYFGLPGNPASTMVTFELFARPAIELLAGQSHSHLPIVEAKLTVPFRHRTGLTRFLPAVLSSARANVTPVAWQGSGDVVAQARANCFLIADPNRESWQAADYIQVLLQ